LLDTAKGALGISPVGSELAAVYGQHPGPGSAVGGVQDFAGAAEKPDFPAGNTRIPAKLERILVTARGNIVARHPADIAARWPGGWPVPDRCL